MNEPLRRALLRARLREDDIAAHLGVDPKTVRRWLNGRVPYPHNRVAIAELVGADEADLWPDAGGLLAARTRPEELGTVYSHRWAVPREVWVRLFESAEREIAILAYSALFLAEDAGILRILAEKGRAGVTVRIALGDPDGPHAAERGEEEGIGDAMPAKIRNALMDAGYSAAALTAALAGQDVHLLIRLASGSVFYASPVTWPGKNGRPGKHGTRVACHKADDPDQANPEPDESLTLPGTPLYGTVRVGAWHQVHPLIHGDRGWFAGWDGDLPVLPGTVLRVRVDHLPDGRKPHKTMWLWHAGPAPLSCDELWRAYLARFDEEHAFKFVKGTLGLTAAKVRTPDQADRWVRLVMAAFAQLLLARPLAADLRRPWETRPQDNRPLSPGRVRRGFANIRARLGTPAHVAKPTRPGPGRPKGTTKRPAPRHPVPKKTSTTDKPSTQSRRSRVKT
jgi:hypothetical protein